VDLNLTLIGQALTFALFVWFTMKYVWPPITKTMQDRQQQIADGLAAAEQGQRDLELAQHKVQEMMTEAKANAASMIEQANQRANQVVEDSKSRARDEGQRLIKMAEDEIQQNVNAARDALMAEVTDLTVASATKVLGSAVDENINQKLVDQLVGEV
jgi:F-type H+-transporting ATPase subunit b